MNCKWIDKKIARDQYAVIISNVFNRVIKKHQKIFFEIDMGTLSFDSNPWKNTSAKIL